MDSFVSSFVEKMSEPVEPKESGEKIDVASPEGDVSDIEPPLSKYGEIKGKPYTVEFLNIEEWDALTPQTDVEGISTNVNRIEEYIAEEIKERGFEDTLQSYKDIMGQLMSAVEINDNEHLTTKLDKLFTYISFKIRMKGIENRNKKILEGLNGTT